MRTRFPQELSFLLLFSLLLALSACGPQQQAASVMRPWLEKPSDHSVLKIEANEVIAHVNYTSGMGQVELFVNGKSIGALRCESPVQSLVTCRGAWNPTSPGDYLLEARVGGVYSAPVSVTVGLNTTNSPTALPIPNSPEALPTAGFPPPNSDSAAATSSATSIPTPTATPTVVPTPSDAVLEAKISDVFHRPSGADPIPVNQGVRQNLREGDGVNVSARGEALLSFQEIFQVRIFRDSKLDLAIVGQCNQKEPPLACVRLIDGSTQNALQALAGQRVQVTTEWATIVAIGTEFWVHYNPKSQLTWIIVKTGAVQVTASGVTVVVQARWQTWVQPGLPPESPVPASRIAVGNLFPVVDALTNGALRDQELLGDSRAQCALDQQANLLGQPDARAEPRAIMPSGDLFVPLYRVRLANGEIWLNGLNSKGAPGWILSTVVRCGFDVSALAEKNAPPPLTPTPTWTPLPPTPTPTWTPSPSCSGAPVISSFSASPSTIIPGGSATLSWGFVSNADSVEISGLGGVATPGSRTVSPTSDTTYTLTARCGSTTRQATVTITRVPCWGTPVFSSSFTASPSTITIGGSTTLSWGFVSNADSVEISGLGGVATPGSRTVSPTSDTTYTLTARCSASRTQAVRQVTVSVFQVPVFRPSPPGDFKATNDCFAKINATNGRRVTLGWSDVKGETGYRIFREGIHLADVPADITYFTDGTPDRYATLTYGVEAYNQAGSSSRKNYQVPGCVDIDKVGQLLLHKLQLK